MSRCSMLLVAALSFVLVPALVFAEGHGDHKAPGTVKSVDVAKLTIVVTEGKPDAAKEVTYTVDAKAKITVDKKEAKLEDVKEGMKIKVTADDKNVATEVSAWTPKEKSK